MRLHRNLAIPAALALAGVLAAGCLQIVKLVTFDLGTLSAVNGAAAAGLYVDLASDNSVYRDNKDKFKNIEDVAVLGTFKNNLAAAVNADVYLVREPGSATLLTTQTAVTNAGGIKVWSMALAANETKVMTWDNSAAQFTSAGKTALKDELAADGIFSLYVFGSTGTYDIRITGGSFNVMVGVDGGL